MRAWSRVATRPAGVHGARLRPLAWEFLPCLAVIALPVLWAARNGGYDAGTWTWGALLLLAGVAVLLLRGRLRRSALSRTSVVALAALTGYAGFSYLSILWAGSPGDALQGSNRTLLYLLLFAIALGLRPSPRAAASAMIAYTIGVGTIAVVLLLRLAAAARVSELLIGGRLAAPTGYWNSTVALFWICALLGIVLSAQRNIPAPLRGLLACAAAASLQLTLVGQSRGWLFTLPIMVVLAILVVRDRLRVAVAAVLPVGAALVPVHRLLAVYGATTESQLDHAAQRAGHVAVLLCAAVFALTVVLAWAEELRRPPALSPAYRRVVGVVLVTLALLGGIAGAYKVTNGDPGGFVSREWHGFANPAEVSGKGSHFATVGSQRVDVWRVALHAFLSHPLGGLGQDNFADYYITRRRTDDEVEWTHSFEMRLLAHSGLVGTVLMVVFLGASLTGLIKVRRRGAPASAALAGAAILPLIVWLVYGSIDWLWEVPALSGPTLAFAGMAMGLGRDRQPAPHPGAVDELRDPAPAAAGSGSEPPSTVGGEPPSTVGGEPPSTVAGEPLPALSFTRPYLGPLATALAVAGLLAATAALGFPYLALREQSAAGGAAGRNPVAALDDLRTAARLNPLSAAPDRQAGAIALQRGSYLVAENAFRQAIAREPGGWFSWFGDGLAASALGEVSRARDDFARAVGINSREPAIRLANAQVDTLHPVTPKQGLGMLQSAG